MDPYQERLIYKAITLHKLNYNKEAFESIDSLLKIRKDDFHLSFYVIYSKIITNFIRDYMNKVKTTILTINKEESYYNTIITCLIDEIIGVYSRILKQIDGNFQKKGSFQKEIFFYLKKVKFELRTEVESMLSSCKYSENKQSLALSKQMIYDEMIDLINDYKGMSLDLVSQGGSVVDYIDLFKVNTVSFLDGLLKKDIFLKERVDEDVLSFIELEKRKFSQNNSYEIRKCLLET